MSLDTKNQKLQAIEFGCKDVTSDLEETIKNIDRFENDPTALYYRLPVYLGYLSEGFFEKDFEYQTRVSKVFYHFAKVCKLKKVNIHLSTDIYLLPRLLTLLENCDRNFNDNWQFLYMILSWLHLLTMAPFKLGNDNHIVMIVSTFLNNQTFYPIVCGIMSELFMKNNDLIREYNEIFKDTGVINSYLKLLVRKPQRQYVSMDKNLLDEITSICLDDEGILTSEYKAINVVKILPKLFKIYYFLDDWDSNERILVWILYHLDSPFTEFRFSITHSYGKIARFLIKDQKNDSMYDVLVESRIEHTTEMLTGFDWDSIDIDELHSTLLIIAELANTVNFDNLRVLQSISSNILYKSSKFQQKRLNQITGTHIRDASNYICWSLARSKSLPIPIVEDLFVTLLLSSLYDRELLIRKTASAALQELLGRHGKLILDNVTVLRLIELPITDIKESFMENTIKLYYLLSEKYENIWKRILNWMVTFNITRNYDVKIVKLNIEAIKKLINVGGHQAADWSLAHLRSTFLFENESQLSNTRFVYFLTELHDLLKWESFHMVIDKDVHDILTLKKHKNADDPWESFRILTILKYWSLKLYFHPNEFMFNDSSATVLIHIIRSISNKSESFKPIKGYLQKILKKLSESSTVISFQLEETHSKFWAEYQNMLKFNVSLACSSLPALKEDIFILYFYEYLPHLDCQGISTVLESLGHYLPLVIEKTGNPVLLKISEFLDDYTITEQGDVGRLVRISAVKLIGNNPNLFFNNLPDLTKSIIDKLLRLMGEPQTELRVLSFKILSEHYDYKFDPELNFDGLILRFYDDCFDKTNKEFWKGYLMSGGAIHSTDTQIKSAIDEFLKYYYSLKTDLDRLEVCNNLIRIIPTAKEIEEYRNNNCPKSSKNNGSGRDLGKVAVTYLQFWVRLFESGITVDPAFNFAGVFAKLFNMQLLKGYNLMRIQALKMMSHLPIALSKGMHDYKNELTTTVVNHMIKIINNKNNKNNNLKLQQCAIEGLAQLYIEFGEFDKLNLLQKTCRDPTAIINIKDSKLII
ncbi:hypothetical protein Kpol_367p6 [Vanderwaltozyma polyspora DSM 70294]|uniref:Tubulin-folding cofactor D ARM repeats domain-containing protein n=1 Tax=Vanderwaltozyma polyspora (strain ATCC 22028 / DSM 70294 / BCRC 21397 / CBS 2163 / NBRC 10782 / NRRL Y-8283 / UCD 57-17) TaxID=436907 RepID=A7TRQ7_VANPO|nr:uncharacterized protein Kpol_367p6 [Vanderwaltozyma polyspora DSM 70294]EDO15051.1 hypothetical protein Kpol_367p6 [Vanderwaltozyma polyspora DSM 70294]